TDGAGHFEKSWFYTRDAVNGKDATAVKVLQSRRYKVERWKAGAGAASSREETDWSYVTTQGDAESGANFVRRDEVRQYQGSGSRKTAYAYDAYGNVQHIWEYQAAADSAWVRHTRRWSIASVDSTHYFVGKLALENVYKWNPDSGYADGEWVRSTAHCYDGSYYWNTAIGSGQNGDDQTYRGRRTALRRHRKHPDLSDAMESVDERYGYDGYGNVTSLTEYNVYGTWDGALAGTGSRQTAITYEATYHSFPETITNPLNQAESRTYDAKWGQPLTITDPNGGVTNYTYDTYGRLTKVEGPQVVGPTGSYRRTTEYGYALPSTINGRTTSRLKIRVRQDTGGATPAWRDTWRYYDGIGRVVQEYAPGFSGVNVVHRYFDPRGLLAKQSVADAYTPAHGEAFLDGEWAGSSGAATSTTYDELRRVLVRRPGRAVDRPDQPFVIGSGDLKGREELSTDSGSGLSGSSTGQFV
ncbi:MAG: RHS repeat protein, partial [Chloroflexi bacterium]|nr:RHS repeat protein [Chloroflexota bacterium]